VSPEEQERAAEALRHLMVCLTDNCTMGSHCILVLCEEVVPILEELSGRKCEDFPEAGPEGDLEHE
jgi:hypothetical protein